MISEALSILAVTGGAVIAHVQSKQQPAKIRRVLCWLVGVALCNLGVLGFTGLLRKSDDLLGAVHALVGHFMLPAVALAIGLWLGTSLPRIWQRPFPAFIRLLFLLLLCFSCLSNTWTGYFGPSSIDPRVDPDTIIRFRAIHKWVMPSLIGLLLVIWLLRLATYRGAAANKVSG